MNTKSPSKQFNLSSPSELERDNPVPKSNKKKKKKKEVKTASPDHFDTHVEDRNWDDSDMSIDMKCAGEAVKYAKVNNETRDRDPHFFEDSRIKKWLEATADKNPSKTVRSLAESILGGDFSLFERLGKTLTALNDPTAKDFNWSTVRKGLDIDSRVHSILKQHDVEPRLAGFLSNPVGTKYYNGTLSFYSSPPKPKIDSSMIHQQISQDVPDVTEDDVKKSLLRITRSVFDKDNDHKHSKGDSAVEYHLSNDPTLANFHKYSRKRVKINFAKVEDNKDIHHDYHIDGIAPRVGTALKILAAEHDPDDSDVSALAEGILRTGDHHILPLLADALDQSNHPMRHEFNWRQIPKAIKRDRRVKALLDNTIIPHILTDGTNKHDRNSLNPEKLINQWHLGRGKISKSKVLKVLKDVDKNANIHDVVHSIIRLADNAKRLEYGADLPSQSPGWYREWVKKNAKMLSGREDIPFMYPNTKSGRKAKMSKKPVKFSHQYPSVQHMPFHPIFKPSGRLGKRSYDWFRKTLFHLYNALPENHPIKESAALAAKTGAHPYFEEIQDWASGIEEGSKEHQALLGSDGGPKRGDYFDDYVNFSGLQGIADSMMEHRIENNDPLMINKPSPSDRGNQREDDEPPASDYSTAFSKTKMSRRRYRFSREDVEAILPNVQSDPNDHASRGALADALEESGLHHDDESLDHLRSFDRPVYGMKHPESGKYVFSPRRRWLLGELLGSERVRNNHFSFTMNRNLENFTSFSNLLNSIGLPMHSEFASSKIAFPNELEASHHKVVLEKGDDKDEIANEYTPYMMTTSTPQGRLLRLIHRFNYLPSFFNDGIDYLADDAKRHQDNIAKEHKEMQEEDKLYSDVKKKEQFRRNQNQIKFSCIDRLREAINNYHTVAKVMARKVVKR